MIECVSLFVIGLLVFFYYVCDWFTNVTFVGRFRGSQDFSWVADSFSVSGFE